MLRKEMATRSLVRWPDGRTIEEVDVTPFSQRVVHWGEFAGWAVLTFAFLYFLAHIVATFL